MVSGKSEHSYKRTEPKVSPNFLPKYRFVSSTNYLPVLLVFTLCFPPVLLIDQSVSQSIVAALLEKSSEEEAFASLPRMSIWQLFNQCSHSYLQAADRTLNARGSRDGHCFSDFYVRVSRKGTIALEHALTKRFVCFNRRRRITVRKESRDRKCHFREHMTPGGFTELESAWRSGLFLGFNRKGRFQESSAYHRKRKCFRFLKIERKLNSADHSGCNTLSSSSSKTAKPDFLNDKHLFETAQLNIFYKIQATVD